MEFSKTIYRWALAATMTSCLGYKTFAATDYNVPSYGVVPNQQQLKWHDMEMYAFVHYTLNTYTGKEWGMGDEKPELFQPTHYDPEQIVKTIADAGLKGIVFTCKHHDGFCMWPTETTTHDIASAPWKNGQGNVVDDMVKACRKYGIKFGVYISPWDRNHSTYGTPEYIKVFRKQLEEILTKYKDDIFIVWQDGACGGDGFYGGDKLEKREVDKVDYYKWRETWDYVKTLVPDACIFSDIGPDVRWVGNERGYARYPHWSTITPVGLNGRPPAPGLLDEKVNEVGTPNGKEWIPAEVDVSIRPGWFWHQEQNNQVKSPERLLSIYFESVGRGANLNLNVPPDKRGRIHENDVESLQEFSRMLNRMYSKNYADNAQVSVSSVHPNTSKDSVLDRKRTTFWMANDDDKQAQVCLKLPEVRTFDVIRLAEPIQNGQRIRSFNVEVKKDGKWIPWLSGESVGARVILPGDEVTTDEIRINILKSDASPALSEISLWTKPFAVMAPKAVREASGKVVLQGAPSAVIRYTLDGSEPNENSTQYDQPISMVNGGELKAKSYLKGTSSATLTEIMPMATNDWKVVSAPGAAVDNHLLFDGNEATLWHTSHQNGEQAPPQSIEIDMGKTVPVQSVLYTPRQDGHFHGIANKYEVYLSEDGKSWGQPVAQGEFSNIKNHPIRQQIDLAKPISARYMKFVVPSVIESNHVTIAELGVLQDKK